MISRDGDGCIPAARMRLAGKTVPARDPRLRSGAPIGPSLKVVERVDDAPADLSIRWAGAVGAVLLERAAGETEEAGRFGRAQKARRQAGHWIGHDRSSVIVRRPPAIGGGRGSQWRSAIREGGWRRLRWQKSPPRARAAQSSQMIATEGSVARPSMD